MRIYRLFLYLSPSNLAYIKLKLLLISPQNFIIIAALEHSQKQVLPGSAANRRLGLLFLLLGQKLSVSLGCLRLLAIFLTLLPCFFFFLSLLFLCQPSSSFALNPRSRLRFPSSCRCPVYNFSCGLCICCVRLTTQSESRGNPFSPFPPALHSTPLSTRLLLLLLVLCSSFGSLGLVGSLWGCCCCCSKL